MAGPVLQLLVAARPLHLYVQLIRKNVAKVHKKSVIHLVCNMIVHISY